MDATACRETPNRAANDAELMPSASLTDFTQPPRGGANADVSTPANFASNARLAARAISNRVMLRLAFLT